MRASDSSYSYEMRRRSDTVDMSWDEVYHRHKDLFGSKARVAGFRSEIDLEEDGYDYTMKLLRKELRFEYGRKRKNQ